MRAAAVITLASLAACPVAAQSTTRDSAGVAIVTSAAPRGGGSGFRVDPAPLLDLGGLGEDDELGSIVGAFLTRDGRVVLADRASSTVRVYEPGGQLLARTGRAGAGPGEFRRITGVFPGPGDSIVVFDAGTRRLSVLSPGGEFVRGTVPEAPGGRPPVGVHGVLADGRVIASAGIGLDESFAGGRRRDSVRIASLPWAGGGGATSVGSFPGNEMDIRITRNAARVVQAVNIVAIPFGRSTAFTTLDTMVVVAEGDRFQLDVYSAAGRLVRSIRRTFRPSRVADADRRRFLEDRLELARDDAARDRLRESLASIEYPETMPAYDMVVASRTGELWVRTYLGPWSRSRPGEWSVFDRSGVWVATVTLPAGVEPLWIGVDRIVARWLDADDVPHLRVYRRS